MEGGTKVEKKEALYLALGILVVITLLAVAASTGLVYP